MRGAALVGVGCALAGVVGGIIWGLLAPGRHQVVGDGGMLLSVDMEGNHVFDALAIFVWVTAAVGVVSGAAAWAWRRMRGPATAVAVLIGSLVGAWFAAGIGDIIARSRMDWPGSSAVTAMVGQVVVQPPSIDLWVVVVAQPVAAGFVYLVATLLSPDANLFAADVRATAIDGTATDGPATDGPASEGAASEGAASEGRASDGPASDDSPVTAGDAGQQTRR